MENPKKELRSKDTNNMQILGPNSPISIGIFVAVVGAAITGTWQWSVLGTDNALRFQKIEIKLDSLEDVIKNLGDDRWRRYDMVQWVKLLEQLNPELQIPPVSGG